jgi:hypothetical protein
MQSEKAIQFLRKFLIIHFAVTHLPFSKKNHHHCVFIMKTKQYIRNIILSLEHLPGVDSKAPVHKNNIRSSIRIHLGRYYSQFDRKSQFLLHTQIYREDFSNYRKIYLPAPGRRRTDAAPLIRRSGLNIQYLQWLVQLEAACRSGPQRNSGTGCRAPAKPARGCSESARKPVGMSRLAQVARTGAQGRHSLTATAFRRPRRRVYTRSLASKTAPSTGAARRT